jgi:hypothetical protein
MQKPGTRSKKYDEVLNTFYPKAGKQYSTRFDRSVDFFTLPYDNPYYCKLFQLFGITIQEAGSWSSISEEGPVESFGMYTNARTSAIKMSISMFLDEERKYFECMISTMILNDTGDLTTGAVGYWVDSRPEPGP